MSKKVIYVNELYHHGVKGMKWGVRHDREKSNRRSKSNDEESRKARRKKMIKIGATVAGVALLSYGGYRLYKSGKFNTSYVKDIVSSANKNKSVASSAASIANRIKPIPKMCNYNSFAAGLNNKINIRLKPGAKYDGRVSTFLTHALKDTDGHLWDTIKPEVFMDKEQLTNVILKVTKGEEGACGQVASGLKGTNLAAAHAFNYRLKAVK